MAYDEQLADRIRDALADRGDVTEKKMFGGLAFLVNGNMAVAAASKGSMMVRVDPDDADEHLSRGGIDRMVMRGKPMNGWLLAEQAALESEEELDHWVAVGTAYAETLPPK